MSSPTLVSALGLTCTVLRNAARHDATNNGISARHGELTVTGIVETDGTFRLIEPHSRVFPVRDDKPEVWLYRRVIGTAVWCLVPALPGDHARRDDPAAIRHWLSGFMAGGNFAAFHDARLNEIVEFYGAVAIHDRTEWGAPWQ